jgi:hypothetical protein
MRDDTRGATMKEITKVLRQAKRDGWIVTITRNNHFRLTHESSRAVTFAASTESDWRSLLNLKARLRRLGNG